MAELIEWERSKVLYLFTSLTAGSSHIVTATSRVETILKNARIPFTYIDTATNESAKKLFQRRARGKKLPLLVKEGFVIADLDEIEEYNEFGELEEVIGDVDTVETSHVAAPAKMELAREGGTPSKPTSVNAESMQAPKAANATVSETELKKENKPHQSSVMGQLAQEAAAKAKQVAKKVPTPLASKMNSTISPTKDEDRGKETDTPLSPSGIPLPNSPAVKSPTSIDSAIKSPASSTSPIKSPITASSPTISHHRHSSTGSTHSSFIPEKSEPEVREHRGSELSAASQEEIKRIESECSIAEEDEEELDEAAEDAILFGDADEEDEKEAGKAAEKTTAKKLRGLSFVEPALTPVTEEKPAGTDTPRPEDASGISHTVSKSSGLTPKEPEKAVESGEVDESDEEDEEESDTEESQVGTEAKATAAAPTSANDALSSAKSAAAGTTATAESTKPVDPKLAEAVDKVKIQDQQPAEGKQASVSVED